MEGKITMAMITMVAVLAVGFLMKAILSANDYEVEWNKFGILDIGNMFDLAKKTTNPLFKVIFYFLPVALPLLYAVAVVLVLTFIFGVGSIMTNPDCENQERFRLSSWEGKVINKYVDSSVNQYRIIQIENAKETITIPDRILQRDEDFGNISVGDSLVKLAEKPFFSIYKPDQELNIEPDFGCN